MLQQITKNLSQYMQDPHVLEFIFLLSFHSSACSSRCLLPQQEAATAVEGSHPTAIPTLVTTTLVAASTPDTLAEADPGWRGWNRVRDGCLAVAGRVVLLLSPVTEGVAEASGFVGMRR
jgi:hypothetical protein